MARPLVVIHDAAPPEGCRDYGRTGSRSGRRRGRRARRGRRHVRCRRAFPKTCRRCAAR